MAKRDLDHDGGPARRAERHGSGPSVDPFLLDLRLPAIAGAVSADILPRLLASHRIDSGIPVRQQAADSRFPAEEVEALALLAIDSTEQACQAALLESMTAGATAEELLLHLIQPAARLLGHWWETDRCSFADVTIATGRLRGLVGHIAGSRAAAEPAGVLGRCLASVSPGDTHSLGIAIVADMLEQDGWLVDRTYGATTEGLVQAVASEPFDLVCLSAGSESGLARLPGLIQSMRRASCRFDIKIMAGGPAFQGRPELPGQLGADAGATDAFEAVRLARRLQSGSGSMTPPSGEVSKSTYMEARLTLR
jgi:methanogenic corrinoid protein MtbC1